MCQMLGVNGVEPVDLCGALEQFFQNSAVHAHGWGFWRQGDAPVREPAQALQSAKAQALLARPLLAKTAFAHIRYATIGGLEEANCHPFQTADRSGRVWTLMHQGTIFDYLPSHRYFYRQKGGTDSERVLLLLADVMGEAARRAGRELTAEERFAALEELTADMAEGNKLNLAIFDGASLYLHTNYRDTLFTLQESGRLWFCTVPLFPGNWQPLPLCTLTRWRDGALRQTGACHGHLYMDREVDQKYLYEQYANL